MWSLVCRPSSNRQVNGAAAPIAWAGRNRAGQNLSVTLSPGCGRDSADTILR